MTDYQTGKWLESIEHKIDLALKAQLGEITLSRDKDGNITATTAENKTDK